jgi:hypothetical protein
VSRQHISGEKGQIPAVQSSKNEPSKREATPSVAKKAAVLSSSMPMPSMQKEDHSKGSESAHQKEENKKKQTSSKKFNPKSLLRITNHFPLSICFLSLLYYFFFLFIRFILPHSSFIIRVGKIDLVDKENPIKNIRNLKRTYFGR